ncbi:DUF5694 domain-containing protein [Jeotgalibacillus sp. ET6]|uniref:DUF5694 domain-containing protein n=1 Tax=Jeotgalibacillus sp. ET6 TaxID=3037260 RepID=UPI002418609A|nr:DUF5694 domain-containing protein [Jeotgalibacillus sp. ET6]MDG5472131.1 DUF5694 domain-containing protein [Jeotgalibacillus sp. ET6]
MKEEKAKVLVLGSFHMSEIETLHTKKRQTEIEEVTVHIARFAPTKIAVEMPADKNMVLNEQYHQYKAGTHSLEMNEIDQIGFRLGQQLGHNQIYAVDWMGEAEMGYGEVEKWAKENQPERYKEIMDGLTIPALTESKSVIEYYRELNDPVWLESLHRMYVNWARIGDVNYYVGIKWLSWWYERNLILFANIARLAELKEDRILFIVGSSHSAIVANFIKESELCEIVEPLDYL